MDKIKKLPNCTKPCKDCPFRKDLLKGWLGSDRMTQILKQESFTCHKTNKSLQCAGHMLINKEENEFYRLAKRLNAPLFLTGQELVFQTKKECINHHKR